MKSGASAWIWPISAASVVASTVVTRLPCRVAISATLANQRTSFGSSSWVHTRGTSTPASYSAARHRAPTSE